MIGNSVNYMGDYVKVAEGKDIQPSIMKAVELNGEKICLANVEGKYYAIGNVCTHLGGPLAQGKLEGYEVQCPWHGSRFDIRSGRVARPPAMRSEPTYEIKVEDDNILVKKRVK
jgi:glycine betaine catabolism B